MNPLPIYPRLADDRAYQQRFALKVQARAGGMAFSEAVAALNMIPFTATSMEEQVSAPHSFMSSFLQSVHSRILT